MSRANLSEEDLRAAPPFYFYVDEFQNFVNDSFAQILSQARKYNLALTVANQYVEEQLTDKVRAAIFGNVGTFICFRIGAPDAEQIEKEFAPNFTADDLVNLGARQIYLKLCIDGTGSKPFSARTMAPFEDGTYDLVPAVIAHSRGVYARHQKDVEQEIKNWYASENHKENSKMFDKKFEEKNADRNTDRNQNKSSADYARERIEKRSESSTQISARPVKSAVNNSLREALANASLIKIVDKKEEEKIHTQHKDEKKETPAEEYKGISAEDIRKIIQNE
jgi:hypothetical protein